MRKKRCETCKFAGYEKGLLGGIKYYCYRYPPLPLQDVDLSGKPKQARFQSVSPEVSATGWCGEFKGTEQEGAV